MRRPSYTPLAAAVAAALVVGAVAAPALAAPAAPAPAAGTATSALQLLGLALGGHTVDVGRVALTSDTVGSAVAKVVVTPIKVDGTSYGEQTVTPASSPATVPTVSTAGLVPAALGALASAKSPVVSVQSSTANGASSSAAAPTLGGVSVLGLPIALNGTLDVSSVVTDASALSQKQVTVTDLALPSVADLLAALGLDLSAIPVQTLVTLLSQLNLVTPAVTTAQQALDTASAAVQTQIDAAQKAVDAAGAAVSAKADELAGKQSQLAAAQADLASKTAALSPLKAALTTAQGNASAASAALAGANAGLAAAQGQLAAAQAATVTNQLGVKVPVPVPAAVTAAVASAAATQAAAATAAAAAGAVVTKATADLAAAQGVADVAATAVSALNGAIAALQAAVDSLQKVLDGLVSTLKGILSGVQPQVSALLAAVTAVLDTTPLVSIDSVSVLTSAKTTSATAGGQQATIVGGELQGLHVLGTDVLDNVLGTSKVDLLDLTGGTLSKVTAAINGLTGTLSSVLSNVPMLPTLSIPAPQITLLGKSTSTDITDGFGVARDSVKALSVTLPAITLPAAAALPSAVSLPAITGLPALPSQARRPALLGLSTDLVSTPITLSLLNLSEQSAFRPAVVAAPAAPAAGGAGTPTVGTPTSGVGTPTAGTPSLPRTGLPAGVSLLAIALVGTSFVLRRRFEATSSE